MDGDELSAVQSLERVIFADPDPAHTRARLNSTSFAKPQLLVAAIEEQASLLGIVEEEYWWIAARSLLAPLPDAWAQYKDTKSGRLYYLNERTTESSWEHPDDGQYREMYRSYVGEPARPARTEGGWMAPPQRDRRSQEYAKMRGEFFEEEQDHESPAPPPPPRRRQQQQQQQQQQQRERDPPARRRRRRAPSYDEEEEEGYVMPAPPTAATAASRYEDQKARRRSFEEEYEEEEEEPPRRAPQERPRAPPTKKSSAGPRRAPREEEDEEEARPWAVAEERRAPKKKSHAGEKARREDAEETRPRRRESPPAEERRRAPPRSAPSARPSSARLRPEEHEDDEEEEEPRPKRSPPGKGSGAPSSRTSRPPPEEDEEEEEARPRRSPPGKGSGASSRHRLPDEEEEEEEEEEEVRPRRSPPPKKREEEKHEERPRRDQQREGAQREREARLDEELASLRAEAEQLRASLSEEREEVKKMRKSATRAQDELKAADQDRDDALEALERSNCNSEEPQQLESEITRLKEEAEEQEEELQSLQRELEHLRTRQTAALEKAATEKQTAQSLREKLEEASRREKEQSEAYVKKVEEARSLAADESQRREKELSHVLERERSRLQASSTAAVKEVEARLLAEKLDVEEERCDLEKKLRMALLAGESLQQECDSLQQSRADFANASTQSTQSARAQLDALTSQRSREIADFKAQISSLENEATRDAAAITELAGKQSVALEALAASDGAHRKELARREAEMEKLRSELDDRDSGSVASSEALAKLRKAEFVLKEEQSVAIAAIEQRCEERLRQQDEAGSVRAAELEAAKRNAERTSLAASAVAEQEVAALRAEIETAKRNGEETGRARAAELEAAKRKGEVDREAGRARAAEFQTELEAAKRKSEVDHEAGRVRSAELQAELEAAKRQSVLSEETGRARAAELQTELETAKRNAERMSLAASAASEQEIASLKAELSQSTAASEGFAGKARSRAEKAESRANEAVQAEADLRAEHETLEAELEALRERCSRAETGASSSRREVDATRLEAESELRATTEKLETALTAQESLARQQEARKKELENARSELAASLLTNEALESSQRASGEAEASLKREVTRLRSDLEEATTRSHRSAGENERKWTTERSALRLELEDLELKSAADRQDGLSQAARRLEKEKALHEDALSSLKNEHEEALSESDASLKRELARLRAEGERQLRSTQAEAEDRWEVEREDLRKQDRSRDEKLRALEAQLAAEKVKSQPSRDFEELKSFATQVEDDLQAALDQADDLRRQLGTSAVESVEVEAEQSLLLKKFSEERGKRRVLHNKLMELQGNIRVIARVRPPNDSENTHRLAVEYEDEGEMKVRNEAGAQMSYEFDSVFKPGSSQAEVFQAVKPMIQSAVDGYHACIFAYGQSGSGKTHTMEGPLGDRGVAFRAFAELLSHRAEEESLSISLSMLEIYNEGLVDLLLQRSSLKPLKLEIRESNGMHMVPNLTQVKIKSIEDVERIVTKGTAQRSTGSHDLNEHSSRSHLIVTLTVEGRGTLNLVDLAGSERLSKTGAKGDRLKEAQAINKSLSALGDVIQALAKQPKNSKATHVPYRNSKLTYLLQDSLSKKSKVLMLVNVSPAESNQSETICSLNFASRCRDVALGGAGGASAAAEATKLQTELENAKITIKDIQGKITQHQHHDDKKPQQRR